MSRFTKIINPLSNLFKKLFKETSWGFATKLIAFPSFFLLNYYLTQKLGKGLWDEWSLFYSYFSIILLVSYFGIRATTKYLAEYNQTTKLGWVIVDSFKLRLGIMLIWMLILLVFSSPFAHFIKNPHYTNLFRISAILIPLTSLAEYFKGSFTGLHQIRYNFVTTATEFSLKLGFVFLLLNLAVSLENVLYGFILAVIITCCIAGWLLYHRFYQPTKSEVSTSTDRPHFLKALFDYSLPLFVISIGFMIATEIDTIMLGWLSNKSQVGDYAVAKQIVTKLPHISYALAMGTMPVFAKITAENRATLQKVFLRVVGLNALIFGGIVLFILLFGDFLAIILGQEYIGSVLPLKILTVYILIFSLIVFLNQLLDYQGLAKKRAINLSFSLLLNIVLNYYLIPVYGAIGAAISTSIAYIPYLLLNARDAYNVLIDTSNEVD